MNSNMPIQGDYRPEDIETHPPVNPVTQKPYDSIMYFYSDGTNRKFKRVAIYDIGQIYPEYVVEYMRIPKQKQYQRLRRDTM